MPIDYREGGVDIPNGTNESGTQLQKNLGQIAY
jgi:hypothetical protein